MHIAWKAELIVAQAAFSYKYRFSNIPAVTCLDSAVAQMHVSSGLELMSLMRSPPDLHLTCCRLGGVSIKNCHFCLKVLTVSAAYVVALLLSRPLVTDLSITVPATSAFASGC